MSVVEHVCIQVFNDDAFCTVSTYVVSAHKKYVQIMYEIIEYYEFTILYSFYTNM